MHSKIIAFLKKNPCVLRLCWFVAKQILEIVYFIIPKHKKQILFASFGGRNFNDSPRAIYEEICKREEFRDWELVWVFIEPNLIDIPRGKKIKMDSPAFFMALLQSRVWVSNSGMDRDIFLKLKNVIKVETWHGTPLKKICGDEHQNTIGGGRKIKGPPDSRTIRCAQSEFDQKLYQRLFHAAKESILLCDLPRNDELLNYSKEKTRHIRKKLNIGDEKKIILYAPTYREYLWDGNGKNLIAPQIQLEKWKQTLGPDCILLFRAHYAVGTALNIKTDDFVIDVSSYPNLNDLYAISDMMISDYSSCFFDYSILDRPMFCFAYDLDEYQEKRGLYFDLKDNLPCKVHLDEDTLLFDVKNIDETKAIELTKKFHRQFAPYAGHASEVVVNEIVRRLQA